MSEGVEPVGGAGIKEMVGSVQNIIRSGRDRDGYGGGGERVGQWRGEGVVGGEGIGRVGGNWDGNWGIKAT